METNNVSVVEDSMRRESSIPDQGYDSVHSAASTARADPGPNVHLNAKYTGTTEREILQELDKRKLSYRTGWPCPPPLPLRTERRGADLWIQDPDLITFKVEAIFKQHGVRWDSAFFAYRTPYQLAGQQRGINTHITLVIIIHAGGMSPESAICATRRLLLQSEGIRFTFIEVTDRRALGDLNTYSVEELHGFMVNRDLIQGLVMCGVAKHEQSVISIDFLRRGVFGREDRMRCPCTVVITTLTAGEEVWWLEILPEIRHRMRAIVRNAEVEVLQGVDNSVAE